LRSRWGELGKPFERQNKDRLAVLHGAAETQATQRVLLGAREVRQYWTRNRRRGPNSEEVRGEKKNRETSRHIRLDTCLKNLDEKNEEKRFQGGNGAKRELM